MTYPNGRALDYGYDNSGLDGALDNAIGRVDYMADAAGSATSTDLAQYSYQGLGTFVGQTDGNGVTETSLPSQKQAPEGWTNRGLNRTLTFSWCDCDEKQKYREVTSTAPNWRRRVVGDGDPYDPSVQPTTQPSTMPTTMPTTMRTGGFFVLPPAMPDTPLTTLYGDDDC